MVRYVVLKHKTLVEFYRQFIEKTLLHAGLIGKINPTPILEYNADTALFIFLYDQVKRLQNVKSNVDNKFKCVN